MLESDPRSLCFSARMTVQGTRKGNYLPYDELIINGHEIAEPGHERVSYILDFIRGIPNIDGRVEAMTENNFPTRTIALSDMPLESFIKSDEKQIVSEMRKWKYKNFPAFVKESF